ncbi:vitellogenin-like isoform X3 [Astyanax mexicanus]|uniref:vitellogenin-like isoform X3 n=1 Tax=Astyanax mexicanus TaxID=7994 RepID=UPI0020CB5C08|nr:vitellogenin-like isoform X3 [Astyanax mexicanus]
MRAVVLALTVALVASQQINLVPEFAAGKTYVYKYEGLLLGGLPQEGLGKAGVKVSSKVLIRAEASTTFLLKLQDPQLFEYAGIWPQDSFSPAAKLLAALNAQLQIPIKFEYANGVVGKIYAPAGVSATVLNLYRGILNILQLNLKNTQNVYEMHEAGTHGVCKAHYMISEDAKTNQIVVRKSKDLTNCHERVIKDIGLAYAEKCAECQQRLQSLTGTATHTYIMKPSDAGAVVAEATVEELHQFSLFNTITGAAQMKAKQTLTLLEVQNTAVAPIGGEYAARGSLKYEFATEVLQTPIQLLKINNAEAQIVETLNHLASNNMDVVHEDAPLKFLQLVQLLRVATFENIKTVWDQYKTKPVHRRWILDATPAVGTPAALKFIKEKFLAGEFTTAEFTQALLVGLHMAKADRDAIQQTADLALSPKIKAIPAVREVVMLGYGSMVARHCAEDPSCSPDLLRPIHDLAAEAISKADISEVTLALKALGNAGHPASLKPIMKILPGFGAAAANMPMKVQVDAILALRNIAKKEPKMVQPVALQLFMDRTLHPEVRMVACIALFETKPSAALMSTVAGAMDKEPSMEVASFAYSYIKSLTRSMSPDLINVAAAANVAIRMLCPKMDRLSYLSSTALHLDLYVSPFMVGAAGSAFIINDAATILPRAVVAKTRAYLAGAAADVLEVGVRTEGLQEALKRTPAGDENADRMTKIKHTLRALMNWKALPATQPLASIYVKLFGQEIAFANVDKTFIEQIIDQAVQTAKPRARELMKEAVKALQDGIAFQYTKPLLAAEIRRIIPTAVGVPMELGFYTAAVAAAAVNVKADITPRLPEQLETVSLDQFKNTDFQVKAEARPSAAIHTFAVIGVNTALIQAAVMAKGKVHTAVPGKMAVRADLPKGNFKVEVLPAATPDHVAAVSFETLAVARNIEDLPAERVASLTPGAEPSIPASIQKTMCVTCPYFHVKGCAEVASRHAGFMGYNPLYYLVGQHKARISVARGDGPSFERLEFEVHVGANAAEKLSQVKSRQYSTESESQEENIILMKLREILEAGLKNKNSSSSSSSSSRSSRSSRSSHSSQSSSISSSRSSSSSSRSSSSQMFRGNDTYGPFQKFHKDQYLASRARSSSASSIETLQRKVKLLEDAVPAVLAVIARVVRSDRNVGYQLAAYLDKPTSRAQITLSPIAEKWKLCADAVLPSQHKVSAKLGWGPDCQDYSATVKAEAGVIESNPAARFEVAWDKLPSAAMHAQRIATEYLPLLKAARLAGFSLDKAENNKDKEVAFIIALPTQKSVNIIVRAPKMTLSKTNVAVPVAVPIEKDGRIPALENLDIRSTIQNLNIRDIFENLDIRGILKNVDFDAIKHKVLEYIEQFQNDIRAFMQDFDIRTINENAEIRAILEHPFVRAITENQYVRDIIQKADIRALAEQINLRAIFEKWLNYILA